MRTAWIILAVMLIAVGIVNGQATRPATGPSDLNSIIAQLRQQIEQLRKENDSLRRELASRPPEREPIQPSTDGFRVGMTIDEAAAMAKAKGWKYSVTKTQTQVGDGVVEIQVWDADYLYADFGSVRFRDGKILTIKSGGRTTGTPMPR